VLAGWEEPIHAIADYESLPTTARRYVEFIERELDVPVTLVGTGADREHVLTRGEVEIAV
jgi:adenylosuccinate synthase